MVWENSSWYLHVGIIQKYRAFYVLVNIITSTSNIPIYLGVVLYTWQSMRQLYLHAAVLHGNLTFLRICSNKMHHEKHLRLPMYQPQILFKVLLFLSVLNHDIQFFLHHKWQPRTRSHIHKQLSWSLHQLELYTWMTQWYN